MDYRITYHQHRDEDEFGFVGQGSVVLRDDAIVLTGRQRLLSDRYIKTTSCMLPALLALMISHHSLELPNGLFWRILDRAAEAAIPVFVGAVILLYLMKCSRELVIPREHIQGTERVGGTVTVLVKNSREDHDALIRGIFHTDVNSAKEIALNLVQPSFHSGQQYSIQFGAENIQYEYPFIGHGLLSISKDNITLYGITAKRKDRLARLVTLVAATTAILVAIFLAVMIRDELLHILSLLGSILLIALLAHLLYTILLRRYEVLNLPRRQISGVEQVGNTITLLLTPDAPSEHLMLNTRQYGDAQAIVREIAPAA